MSITSPELSKASPQLSSFRVHPQAKYRTASYLYSHVTSLCLRQSRMRGGAMSCCIVELRENLAACNHSPVSWPGSRRDHRPKPMSNSFRNHSKNTRRSFGVRVYQCYGNTLEHGTHTGGFRLIVVSFCLQDHEPSHFYSIMKYLITSSTVIFSSQTTRRQGRTSSRPT